MAYWERLAEILNEKLSREVSGQRPCRDGGPPAAWLVQDGRVTVTAGVRRLTTPRAAALAGVLFAVLFSASLVLIRKSVPNDPFAEPDWVTDGAGRLRLAMTLVPLAGIAFLWFVGVVRDRLGDYEDRFFSSVFYRSGLLFLAMVFVSMAMAGGIVTFAAEGSDQAYDVEVVRFGRATMLEISNVYALRMAAVFMISLGTIWLRTRLMPRWLVGVTCALALMLLVVTTLSLWTALVFPAWVFLVSLLILAASGRAGGVRA
jgi:hypothetical protein